MGIVIFNIFGKSKGVSQPKERWSWDQILLDWNAKDAFTLRSACQGVGIFGGVGSGKTSGTMDQLALAYLDAGMGGIVMTAKADEVDLWIERARLAGRSGDVVLVGPDYGRGFNFLDWEMGLNGQSENVANLLSDVIAIAERAGGQTGGGGGDNESYFRRAAKALTKNAIDVLRWAGEPVGVPNLHEFISSMPTSKSDVASEDWQKHSYFFGCMARADDRVKEPAQRRDLKEAAKFGLKEWPGLSDRTRSSIASTVTFALDTLNRGVLRDLLCGDTTVTPDVIGDGKIVICAMPVKVWGDVGSLFQTIWKLAVMRWAERRDVRANPRPVMIVADEAQNFLVPKYDAHFLATCRSQRVAVLMASQNLPNYYVNLSGDKGKHEADALLGCLGTHVYHANACSVTNEWAAQRIGRSRQYLFSGSSGPGDDADAFGMLTGTGKSGGSASFSEHYEMDLQPAAFTRLRSGGPDNDWVIDAVVVQANAGFKLTGKIWLAVSMRQRH